MTVIWIILWVVFSTIILGAAFWSLIIQYKQKKTWEAFAKKAGLKYMSGTFTGPCGVEGVLDGYDVSLFTAEQQNIDSRKNRKVTGLQVNANEGFVDGLAAGTPEVRTFIKSLGGLSNHDMKGKKWDKNLTIFSRHKEAVNLFLTEERVDTIKKMLNIKNADVILLLDENEGGYRIETSNPLTDLEQLEKMVKATIARYKKLSVTKEEIDSFKKTVKSSPDGGAEDTKDE
ncbi:MAG: hypothetical protein CMH31_06675 [Micavibrio sp.]|nr:hypothetical protein [Micavibrio sp.]